MRKQDAGQAVRQSYSPDIPRPTVVIRCGQVLYSVVPLVVVCQAELQLRRRPLKPGAYSTFCPICRTRGRVQFKNKGKGE